MRKNKGLFSLAAAAAAVFSLYFGLASCRVKLSETDLQAKARKIHEKVLTVDTHCDTPSFLQRKDWDIGQRHEPGKRGSGAIDLPRMKEGGLDAEFFAVYIGQGERSPEGYAKAGQRALQMFDAIHNMCQKYPDLVGLATTPADAYRLEKQGKRAAFIGLENGYPIGKNLAYLEEYYQKGVRYLTLCHSGDNDICDSSTDEQHPEDNGLSEFGRDVVAACNRLGIMVDVSHMSDRSFFDVLNVTKAPIFASHSCCRALCNSPRNLSDDMLRALAANGGVLQICLLSSYLKEPKPNPERDNARKEIFQRYGSLRDIKDEALREKVWQELEDLDEKYPESSASVKDIVDHVEHAIKVVGIDCVGIGTDFDGGGRVSDCQDVSQMPRITEELVRRGYSEKEIAKIWGGNIMRVFDRVIEISKKLSSKAE